MQRITPCRSLITERFPVASFAVEVPPGHRFEIACASDPELFRPEHRDRRTHRNFYTSRYDGLLSTPAGQATYLMPAEQLCNFAGADRVYYVLASFGSSGEYPALSVEPHLLDETPYIRVSPDFTGGSLRHSRLPGVEDTRRGYGSRALGDRTWGGDALLGGAPTPGFDELIPASEPDLPAYGGLSAQTDGEEGEAPEIEEVGVAARAEIPPHPEPPPPPPAPPPRVAPTPPTATGAPLTISEKFRVLLSVARQVSGQEMYSAISLNVRGGGLGWGLLLFSQRSGLLGQVLRECHRRDPAQFVASFGPEAGSLLRVTTAATDEARMQPVDGRDLWAGGTTASDKGWPDRFRHAGRFKAFRAAQNQVGIERFVDDNLVFAARLGFDSDRALAMLADRCQDLGAEGGRRWIADTLSPVRSREDRDAALAALGHGNLTAFQRTADGLEPDGRWGPDTAAALIAALRRLGPRSPLRVPDRDLMLLRLVEAAEEQKAPWATRVKAIHDNRTELHDSVFLVG